MIGDYESEVLDVIIVGAGLAGLTAGHTLKHYDPSLRVLVLEADHRVGGKLKSEPMKTSAESNETTMMFDLGCHVISN